MMIEAALRELDRAASFLREVERLDAHIRFLEVPAEVRYQQYMEARKNGTSNNNLQSNPSES
ncbi:hypothetical protein ACFL5Q_07395 [Planctomycetota bacterium]